ncbi:transmembrane protein [Legionella moravica]|uniref:Transmembrane protein n=1 Tax=Legionella moravica TaxID=39962 RepID=A0A378JWQ1_9GAMM|nr:MULTISPECIES: DUF6691 family protein [Legionella]KTD33436.1 transmembrane protein [Legionella moravica]RUR18545.1 YeeE/YedE family protein [Legionella sp. km535]STX61808.1 transmembrane protein [Legionella moravica]
MKKLISLLTGLMFGTGLILTGMYSPDIIIAGLKIGAETFRINLYLTFVTALLVTFLLFQLRRWLAKPLMNSCYDLPSQNTIDWKLIVGALLFGIGWGIAGICPGPNLVGLGLFSWPFYWINFAGIISGFLIVRYVTLKKANTAK